MTRALNLMDLAASTFCRAELERAIADDQLELFYQPVVSLTDQTITGFEALVRWRHPRLGLLCAAQIVPHAERCGLIRALDDWVLRTAFAQADAWQEEALVAPGFRMAVNVSGAEMDGDRLVERVGYALSATGVDPRGLVIEVTETCRINSIDDAKRSADGLHALGLELALDDFGSHDATFSRLWSLPFDVLKIDREFVTGSHSELGQAFVRALMDLGDRLRTRIVAEGVETAAHANRLRALGSHEGQGFFWAPALPAEQASTALTAGISQHRAVTPNRGRRLVAV
jgi:EAL domain-containing protein (putative c-di-GMP-specific phosphodiesterase class I)